MNVPKLRFKGEDGSEFSEWQRRSIGEILTIGSGKDYKHLSTGDVPVYGTGGYMLSVNDYLYDGESVCIGRKGTIDKPTLLNGKFWTVDTLFYTHSFKNSIPKFVYAIFQRIDWKNHNEASGVPSLSKSTIEKIKIQIPSISEQTKIASFLTSVDEKITQLTQKTDLLAQYKKGLMQQIFSQELRFKDDDGSEFPEWRVCRMGDLYSFQTTNSLSRDNLNYEIGEVKNIHYGDIHTKFSTLFDITKEDVPFINPEVSISKIPDSNYCQEGDLIFADASEDLNDVGKSIEIVNLNNEKLLSGLHTILARPKLIKFSKGFAGYLFKSGNIRLQIQKESQGSKVLSISATRLSNISLSIPALKEQTKIANFLTAIDDKITQTQAELNAVKQYKQGLLQQMFV